MGNSRKPIDQPKMNNRMFLFHPGTHLSVGEVMATDYFFNELTNATLDNILITLTSRWLDPLRDCIPYGWYMAR